MNILSNLVVGADAKPVPLKVNPEGVPEYLRTRKQWVCWKYEPGTDKDGNRKWTKIPYHPRDFKAASNNPDTWATFEQVLSAQETMKFAGIGFMLGEDDGLAAIDLDHCIDPNTEEFTKPEAQEIVERFKGTAYVERSPGGDGIRLFVLGKPPRSGKGKAALGLNWIEVYAHPSSRYLTVTGNVLADWSVAEPLEAQQSLGWLNDQYLKQAPRAPAPVVQTSDAWEIGEVPERIRARWVDGANDSLICDDLVGAMDRFEDDCLIARIEASKQGPKFAALFLHGKELDVSTGELREGLDASSMDAALVGILGFWGRNDVEQVHRIMSRSKLAEREKWDSPRGDSTYGRLTVEKIISERVASGADVWRGDEIPVGGEPVEPPKTGTENFPEPFPGFMDDMVRETLAVAHKPQPELTLISVLIGMAAACDGHVRLPDGGRLNIFALGVVESGEGKDLPRRVAEDIAYSCGAKLVGTPASGQGLEDSIVEGQGMLCAIDEIGHTLQALHAEKAPSHLIEVAKNLLRFYSAGNGNYVCRERAATKNVKPGRVVRNPTLNLIGFTTPSELAKGLTADAIESGLLGRFLFCTGRSNVKQRYSTRGLAADPIWFEAIKQFNIDSGSAERVIQIPEDVDQRIRDLLDRLHAERVASSFPEERALLTRTLEKILRVAGVLSFWSDHKLPVMGRDHLEWAERFVRASNGYLLGFARDRIHNSVIQANAAKLKRVVEEYLSGDRPAVRYNWQRILLNESRLVSRSLVLWAAHIEASEAAKAINHAVQCGDLEAGEISGPDGKKREWLALPSQS